MVSLCYWGGPLLLMVSNHAFSMSAPGRLFPHIAALPHTPADSCTPCGLMDLRWLLCLLLHVDDWCLLYLNLSTVNISSWSSKHVWLVNHTHATCDTDRDNDHDIINKWLFSPTVLCEILKLYLAWGKRKRPWECKESFTKRLVVGQQGIYWLIGGYHQWEDLSDKRHAQQVLMIVIVSCS